MDFFIEHNVISIALGLVLGFAVRWVTRFPGNWLWFIVSFVITIGSTFVNQSWTFITPWLRVNWLLFGAFAYLTMAFLFGQLRQERQSEAEPARKRRRRAMTH